MRESNKKPRTRERGKGVWSSWLRRTMDATIVAICSTFSLYYHTCPLFVSWQSSSSVIDVYIKTRLCFCRKNRQKSRYIIVPASTRFEQIPCHKYATSINFFNTNNSTEILIFSRDAFLPFEEKKSLHVVTLRSTERRDCPTLHKKRSLLLQGIERPRYSSARFPLSRRTRKRDHRLCFAVFLSSSLRSANATRLESPTTV